MSQGLNRTSIIGWLGRDPETNDTGTVTRFSVGVTERWKDAEGTEKEHTEWFRVTCFNGIAAACSQYLSCGRQVYVDGRLRTRSYTSRDGEEKTVTELLAQSVIFLDSPRTDEDRLEQLPKPGNPAAMQRKAIRGGPGLHRQTSRRASMTSGFKTRTFRLGAGLDERQPGATGRTDDASRIEAFIEGLTLMLTLSAPTGSAAVFQNHRCSTSFAVVRGNAVFRPR